MAPELMYMCPCVDLLFHGTKELEITLNLPVGINTCLWLMWLLWRSLGFCLTDEAYNVTSNLGRFRHWLTTDEM
jgi:hypothetical protein